MNGDSEIRVRETAALCGGSASEKIEKEDRMLLIYLRY